jgi:hypothetical protein
MPRFRMDRGAIGPFWEAPHYGVQFFRFILVAHEMEHPNRLIWVK